MVQVPGLPTVSVIVPTYGDAEQLPDLVAAVRAQTYPADLVELIIVDNHPVPTVHLDDPSARIVHEPEPGSYRARNTGIAAATGAVLAFTDADCVPEPQWLAAGVAAVADGVAVGGAVRVTARPDCSAAELYQLRHAFPQERYVAQGYAVTANLLIRRDDLLAVGGFDATLYSSGDRELGMRARAGGVRYTYAPEAVVDHQARSSARALRKKARRVGAGAAALARSQGGWRSVAKDCLDSARPPLRRLWSTLRDPATPLRLRVGVCEIVVSVYVITLWTKVRQLLPGRPDAPRA